MEIGQIAITVSEVSKVLPFFRDLLGLKFLFNPNPNLAFLSADPVRIMLSTPPGIQGGRRQFHPLFQGQRRGRGSRRPGQEGSGQRAHAAADGEVTRPRIVDRFSA